MASENIDIVVANDLMSGKLISFFCCSSLKKSLLLHVIESSLSVLLLFLDIDCICDEILWLCVDRLVKANPFAEMNATDNSVVAVACREDNLIVYYQQPTQYLVKQSSASVVCT